MWSVCFVCVLGLVAASPSARTLPAKRTTGITLAAAPTRGIDILPHVDNNDPA